MRLSGRVRVLERRSGVAGPCPACGGAGAPGYECRFPGYAPGPRGGCRRCGCLSHIGRLTVTRDERDGAERQERAACA